MLTFVILPKYTKLSRGYFVGAASGHRRIGSPLLAIALENHEDPVGWLGHIAYGNDIEPCGARDI
jgi:hypothetical protein